LHDAILDIIIFLLISMKKLRSLLALFLMGVLTSFLFANSVWSLNSASLRSATEPANLDTENKIIAFGRSNSRRQYLQQLEEADRFYQQGALSTALKIQKDVKASFANTGTGRRKPIDDPEKLSGGAGVYYREGKAGLEQGLITKALIPLQRLSEDYPEFIQGHLMLAQAARQFSDNDAKIVLKRTKIEVELEALERGSSIFPERKDILNARLKAFAYYEKFIEASVTARQFAVLFPDDPDSGKYLNLAEQYLALHRKNIQEKIFGLAAAGSIFGDRQIAAQIVSILSQSESEYGAQGAEQFKQQNQIVTDPEVVSYVNRIGQKIAKTMGRNEFQYEFYVYRDDNDVNAFALPGGKIFIATGLLNLIGTEAELAGLIGHEVGHAVLSHSYIKQVERLAAGAVGDLFGIEFLLKGQLADNSRTAEKQSDILGTRAIVSGGYSADGVWNVMRVLKSVQGDTSGAVNYLSSHPPASDRVAYLEEFIDRNGFNRFGYEGVSDFRNMQKRLGGEVNSDRPAINDDRPIAKTSDDSRVAAVSGCQSGKVPLSARINRDQVTVSLDGAFVKTSCSSFDVTVRIKNDSNRAFTFVPGFVQVFNSSGDQVKARLVMKKDQTPTAQAGQEIEGTLQVFKHRWSNNGKQDLTLELKEGSSVARVFRVAF
jgi:Zn-dependent protease with chaperone function